MIIKPDELKKTIFAVYFSDKAFRRPRIPDGKHYPGLFLEKT